MPLPARRPGPACSGALLAAAFLLLPASAAIASPAHFAVLLGTDTMRVRTPVLIITGSTDQQTTPEQVAEQVAEQEAAGSPARLL